MTYNFDPDRWYDNERAALESALKSGRINAAEYRLRLEELGRRLDDMVDRLDGTYRLPE